MGVRAASIASGLGNQWVRESGRKEVLADRPLGELGEPQHGFALNLSGTAVGRASAGDRDPWVVFA